MQYNTSEDTSDPVQRGNRQNFCFCTNFCRLKEWYEDTTDGDPTKRYPKVQMTGKQRLARDS